MKFSWKIYNITQKAITRPRKNHFDFGNMIPGLAFRPDRSSVFSYLYIFSMFGVLCWCHFWLLIIIGFAIASILYNRQSISNPSSSQLCQWIHCQYNAISYAIGQPTLGTLQLFSHPCTGSSSSIPICIDLIYNSNDPNIMCYRTSQSTLLITYHICIGCRLKLALMRWQGA